MVESRFNETGLMHYSRVFCTLRSTGYKVSSIQSTSYSVYHKDFYSYISTTDDSMYVLSSPQSHSQPPIFPISYIDAYIYTISIPPALDLIPFQDANNIWITQSVRCVLSRINYYGVPLCTLAVDRHVRLAAPLARGC